MSDTQIQPDRIKVGGAVILLSLEGLAGDWGITKSGVLKMLSALGSIEGVGNFPLIKFPGGDKRYISLYPLEKALFALGLPAAMRGERRKANEDGLMDVMHQTAAILYGTLTKEVVRQRIRLLAQNLKKESLTKGPRKPRVR